MRTHLSQASHRSSSGRIGRYKLFLSTDGRDWGQAAATGTWTNVPAAQTVKLPAPATARYVKLVAESEVNGNPFAAVAEIEVLLR